MAKEFKITSLRLADLEKELNYLKTTREREVAAMIAEARSYGDLSENSEYDAAKNEQAKLYGRIAEIEDVLSHAVIIEDENEASGRVGLGCTVVVEDENGKQTEYRITGSQEANPMEFKLSDDSPFGRAVVVVGEPEGARLLYGRFAAFLRALLSTFLCAGFRAFLCGAFGFALRAFRLGRLRNAGGGGGVCCVTTGGQRQTDAEQEQHE